MRQENSALVCSPGTLVGKKVLVTGASSGFGCASAIQIATMGGKVVLGGRDTHRLEQVCKGLPGEGHQIAPLDIARLDQIPAWLSQISANYGPLYGLVHCAGSQGVVPLRYVEDAQIEDSLNVNVAAPLVLLREFRKKTNRLQDDARVVLMSSVMAMAGETGRCLYSSCRGAVLALVKSAAIELAPEKIRVNAVVSGLVPTEGTQGLIGGYSEAQLQSVTMAHPLGLGRPDDVANAITFLLAPESRWITGTTLVVDGGYLAR